MEVEQKNCKHAKGQKHRQAQDQTTQKETYMKNEQMTDKLRQYLRNFDSKMPLHEQEFAKTNCMKMDKKLNSYCINQCPECGEGKLEQKK